MGKNVIFMTLFAYITINMQMSEFFKKMKLSYVVFYTLHLTCVQIFSEIGRFTAEILWGAPGRPKTSNSPAFFRVKEKSYLGGEPDLKVSKKWKK